MKYGLRRMVKIGSETVDWNGTQAAIEGRSGFEIGSALSMNSCVQVVKPASDTMRASASASAKSGWNCCR